MLPGFRFIVGAVLASVVLIVVAFGLAATVRMAHVARMGPLDSSRSLAYADPDESRSRWPDAVGSIARMSRRTDDADARRQGALVEPLPAPAGPGPLTDDNQLSEAETTDDTDDLAAEAPVEAAPAPAQRTVVVASPVIAGKPEVPTALRSSETREVKTGEIALAPADERPRLAAAALERIPATEAKALPANAATITATTESDGDVTGAIDEAAVKETGVIPAREVASIPSRRIDLVSPPEARPTVGERVASMPPPSETAALNRDDEPSGEGTDTLAADEAGRGIGGPLALVKPDASTGEPEAQSMPRATRTAPAIASTEEPQSEASEVKSAPRVAKPKPRRVANVASQVAPAAATPGNAESRVQQAGQPKAKGVTSAKGKQAKARKATRTRRAVRRGFIRPTAQTGYPISLRSNDFFR